MIKTGLLFTIGICAIITGCKTSGTSNSSTKRKQEIYIAHQKQKAKDHYYLEHYAEALDIFLELDSLTPNNPNNIYHIGICYMELKNNKCLPYFEKCLESSEKFPHALHFYAGGAYHLNEKFYEAIEQYKMYRVYLYEDKKTQKDFKLINNINRNIEICKNGLAMVKQKLDVEIINLSDRVNSEYPDYGPVLTADEKTIIFTSERPSTASEHKDMTDGTYNEDMYISHKNEQDVWSIPKKLNINTPGQDASVSLTPDGQKLLVYHYNKNHFMARNSGDIYLSKMVGDTFTQPEPLPGNINSPYWESGASMSADGNSIYFSSNRKGSIGGTDIYIVRKLPNGQWAEAQNFGSIINTPYNEDSPFIHPDGKTLYFSSDGHNTIGGFDIFYSVLNEETNQWSVPKNIGYPINTPHDDLHFALSTDGTRIYFSSARKESGNLDIYYADIKEDKHKLLILKGYVLDSLTKKPIEAVIKVKDAESDEILGIYNSNSSSGKYLVVFTEDKYYSIEIEAQGYQLCTDVIDSHNLSDYEEREEDIILCPVEKDY